MGWHRRRPVPGEASSADASSVLKLLWQHDTLPVYLMDNHLGALWCWRRHMPDCGERYRLVHVDAHWDAASDAASDAWLSARDLDAFTALRSPVADAPLVRWDNYVSPFLLAYPNVTRACVTAHQDEHMVIDTTLGKLDHVEIYAPTRFLEGFDEFLDADATGATDTGTALIVNLDLDFFFGRMGDSGPRQLFSDAVIRDLFAIVAARLSHARVVTIALSPECCGGWRPALDACKLAFEGLGLEMPAITLT
jgi:hypothetical protein